MILKASANLAGKSTDWYKIFGPAQHNDGTLSQKKFKPYNWSPCYVFFDLVTLMTSKAFLAQKIDLNPFLVYENYFEYYSGAALS